VENDETFTVCPYCRGVVDPGDPTATYAVAQVELIAMGPTRHIADGLGGYFHAGCSPEAVSFERRPRPETTS
jgi:hypothetical protein